MKTEFIVNSSNTTRLILIFAGWNTDPTLYQHIRIPGWDTLVAYDYDGEMFPNEILSRYTTIYLFAWSLGVAASLRFLNCNRVTKRIAINGTTTPVSDEYGIPENIFTSTEQTLNEKNLLKFRMRMAGGKDKASELLDRLPANPNIDELKRQLRLFLDESHNRTDSTLNKTEWDRVYISQNDLIFPIKNQQRSWETESVGELITLEEPHYIDVGDIVKSLIPNLQTVAESFSTADSSYDMNATAQKKIAEMLTDMIPEINYRPLRVLEIGTGSGLFSRMYVEKLHPDSITYIDLYPIHSLGLAVEEIYITGDAEEFLRTTDKKWDVILSASTIQWFVNLPEFFRNARRCLTDNGFLGCSTFLPDNLRELREARPSTLIYHSEEELQNMLNNVFDEVKTDTLNVDLQFESARDALTHLKWTGVGSAHNSNRKNSIGKRKYKSALNILEHSPTLHYSAFLFIAK